MDPDINTSKWFDQFPIQSVVDLDFVIGQQVGWPVGMQRSSPPELRRRILAAAISYQAGLRSVDYALKRYVDQDTYETAEICLGDLASDFLVQAIKILRENLSDLHTREGLTFGIFGAEMTLFKVPSSLEAARILANRGLILEVIPVLRLCLEMAAWAAVAFYTEDEDRVRILKAQQCISQAKPTYKSIGNIYGYFCQFSHWNFEIQRQFIKSADGAPTVNKASCRNRALSLSYCLVVLDFFLKILRKLYPVGTVDLIDRAQRQSDCTSDGAIRDLLEKIADFGDDEDLRQVLHWVE